MIKKIAAVLAAVIAVILILAAMKPNTFHVERKVVIKAAPEKIFPWLENPQKTTEWSPWEKKDPAMKKTFSGPAKGVGAAYAWDGNKEIGAGRIELTEVVAPKKVVMNLDFIRPMEGHSVAAYEVAPVAGGSEVTWSISGPQPFMSKIMCLFMNMDKMIGGEFEKGLADLKTIAEK